MIEPGRTGGYVVLFSEIGIVLLVTTLAGVGIGYWVDTRLDTRPLFVLVGLFIGMGVGAWYVWILIKRFLATFDDQPKRPMDDTKG